MASDVQRVVYEELVRWFDAGNAGTEERYSLIASEIWGVLQVGWQPATRCSVAQLT